MVPLFPELVPYLREVFQQAKPGSEHVVCAWIGNSKVVARKHYLQVTEEHFERAARFTGRTSEAAQN